MMHYSSVDAAISAASINTQNNPFIRVMTKMSTDGVSIISSLLTGPSWSTLLRIDDDDKIRKNTITG
jgi:hypothetical protein